MRRYPVFLEQFGWKQRRYAILAAGIFEQLEEESMDEFEKGKNQVCHFRCSFYFMRFSSMLCCI